MHTYTASIECVWSMYIAQFPPFIAGYWCHDFNFMECVYNGCGGLGCILLYIRPRRSGTRARAFLELCNPQEMSVMYKHEEWDAFSFDYMYRCIYYLDHVNDTVLVVTYLHISRGMYFLFYSTEFTNIRQQARYHLIHTIFRINSYYW